MYGIFSLLSLCLIKYSEAMALLSMWLCNLERGQLLAR